MDKRFATMLKLAEHDTMHAITQKEILTKLGMALYLHKKEIERAEKGKDAIKYLAEQGVL